MGWWRWLACFAALLGTASCGDDAATPLLNRCAQAFECIRGTKCDTELGFCVREQVSRPYPLVVLVIPAGGTLIRTTTPVTMLTGPTTLDPITVRRSVAVSGAVLDSNLDAVSAEVAFVPDGNGSLVGGVSAFTQPLSESDGGAPTDRYGFSAQLQPRTNYVVRVFPLGLDSERLPPESFVLATSDVARTARFAYAELHLQTRVATLLDENKKAPPPGSKVRLRRKLGSEYVSSIGKPDTTAGKTYGQFNLDAPANVLNDLSSYELVLEVPFGDAPATVSIVFDATLFKPDATLVMPVVPDSVLYTFSLEFNTVANVSAEVTFESSFRVQPQPNDLRQTDWCRLKLPGSPQGTFTCSTVVKSSATGPGSVKLLPGYYDLYFSANGDAQATQRLATLTKKEIINSQTNGTQNGQSVAFTRATVYSGAVSSPLDQPMPFVTITATALGLVQTLPELARFNRTSEQVSDGQGQFQLAVDMGYYDLLATPPDGSGYASVMKPNRRIDEQAMEFLVQPQLPVIARGSVMSEAPTGGGAETPLSQARIEAYAVVDDLASNGGTRAVRIAHTVSDSKGLFALTLPPYIGDLPSAGDGGVTSESFGSTAERDGALGLDAGH
ncbi:MAG: hypothetical protein JWN04_915 [Myxococcaceae bacterium]|nr:hypothetical protein [Myxococcaceae bacterium]